MLSTVYSGAVHGVDAYPVEIEVNAGYGEFATVIVGLPDTVIGVAVIGVGHQLST